MFNKIVSVILLLANMLVGSTFAVSAESISDSQTFVTSIRQSSLVASRAPGENFDLSNWYLSIPTDKDSSNTADSIKGKQLNQYQDEFFFTAEDGGMVFKCPVGGYKTSENTSFTRVELRELVNGSTFPSPKNMKNNWAFSSNQDKSFLQQVGAIDGVMQATLAVNHVTTTGKPSKRGRVVIGQIHAPDDEPIRLYYHKTPENEKGVLYFAHEPLETTGLKEQYVFLYGNSRASDMENPENGIPLNEVFSYEIQVIGNRLIVSVFREHFEPKTVELDMSTSGYNVSGQYMYFKAGLYNQHASKYGADSEDFAQVTFYRLDVSH